jgi:hypothetical protein
MTRADSGQARTFDPPTNAIPVLSRRFWPPLSVLDCAWRLSNSLRLSNMLSTSSCTNSDDTPLSRQKNWRCSCTCTGCKHGMSASVLTQTQRAHSGVTPRSVSWLHFFWCEGTGPGVQRVTNRKCVEQNIVLWANSEASLDTFHIGGDIGTVDDSRAACRWE